MGYLVLQSDDDKTFDVIDGQQRLTTITIIVLAVLKNLQRLIERGSDADANRQSVQQIQQSRSIGLAQEDKQLTGVLKTFRVRQPFPLLLAAKRVFELHIRRGWPVRQPPSGALRNSADLGQSSGTRHTALSPVTHSLLTTPG